MSVVAKPRGMLQLLCRYSESLQIWRMYFLSLRLINQMWIDSQNRRRGGSDSNSPTKRQNRKELSTPQGARQTREGFFIVSQHNHLYVLTLLLGWRHVSALLLSHLQVTSRKRRINYTVYIVFYNTIIYALHQINLICLLATIPKQSPINTKNIVLHISNASCAPID